MPCLIMVSLLFYQIRICGGWNGYDQTWHFRFDQINNIPMSMWDSNLKSSTIPSVFRCEVKINRFRLVYQHLYNICMARLAGKMKSSLSMLSFEWEVDIFGMVQNNLYNTGTSRFASYVKSCVQSRENKFEFLVNLDCFSKYLKYLWNFEKRSKSTKNLDSLSVVNVLLSPIILSQVRLFSDLNW